ncbi:polysaccharide biosynthesis protein [Spirochaeta cellobiosiphila]|uniref:polysaccharide biosynthesis protein n=1 Tax=Spirochaeta cellobiosiphila TaxID=504483 RepID=UPI0004269FE6|nr:nucleoside-diphosphate sugar epimerase/dehydratase [Spirochaeta cellobiosiphila]
MELKKRTILLIGAGFAGRQLLQEIKQKGHLGKALAFVDDDPDKIGTDIDGVPVYGPISQIKTINESVQAEEAIITIPSGSPDDLKRIYNSLQESNFIQIRLLPNVSQIVNGEAHLIQTREIDPQDLLGRPPIFINLKESLSYLRGKRVLITGAGGSIGSELARQLLSGGAERLYLFGHGENSIYLIEKELRLLQKGGVGEKATIVPIIGELRDQDFMDFILTRLKADVIFHCAAHKHVPLMEANPVEAVINNVFGTYHLLKAAEKAKIPKLVLISTDKAVNPNSTYGVSKFFAEQLVLSSGGPNQDFMVVRFANVLGSRGSILPLFKEQILTGGPITITDSRATRYFMTIPEAASLVLQAGGVGQNRDLYLLDMGEPVNIEDLARQMTTFYGFKPEQDIAINYIGLRPGEKLYERLYSSSEEVLPTQYHKLNKIIKKTPQISMDEILEQLKPICFYDPQKTQLYRNRKALRATLNKYVPTLEIPDNEPEY